MHTPLGPNSEPYSFLTGVCLCIHVCVCVCVCVHVGLCVRACRCLCVCVYSCVVCTDTGAEPSVIHLSCLHVNLL